MDVLSGVLSLLISLQWFQSVTGSGEVISKASSKSVDPCSCYKTCSPSGPKPDSVSSQQLYFYDSKAASCVELSPSCVMNSSCVFSSELDCTLQCGAITTQLDLCQAAKYGCCPDGSLRSPDKKCPHTSDSGPSSLDSANGSPSSSSSSGVRWDLVASGACLLILLVAVLSVSGIMTYHYREKQKERIRSRYIHNVLEMYESGSDSSDSEAVREGKGTKGASTRNSTGSCEKV